jgi:hypothetical protein
MSDEKFVEQRGSFFEAWEEMSGALSNIHLVALVNGEQRGSVGPVRIRGKFLFSEAL